MPFGIAFKKLPPLLLITALARIGAAQGVAQVPPQQDQPNSGGLVMITPKEVQERRREYAEAYKDFQENKDQSMIDDLVKHPEKRAEILQRIQAQRDRDRKMLQAQGKYYQSVRTLYNQVYQAVSKPSTTISRDEDKKRLQEVSDGLFEQRKRYEEENAKETNPLIKSQYDALISDYRKAEDANKSYQLLLDNLKQNDMDITQARAKAMASQNEVIAAFDKMVKDNEHRAAQRDKMYDSFVTTANRPVTAQAPAQTPALPPAGGPPGGVPPLGPGGAATSTEPKTEVRPAVTTPNPPPPPPADAKGAKVVVVGDTSTSFTGKWQSKAKTGVAVSLDVTDTGGTVKGWFEAIRLPPASGLQARVRFEIAAEKKLSSLTNSYSLSLGGHYGELELVPTASGVSAVWTLSGDNTAIFDGILERTDAKH